MTSYTHATTAQQRDKMLADKSRKRTYEINEDIPIYPYTCNLDKAKLFVYFT